MHNYGKLQAKRDIFSANLVIGAFVQQLKQRFTRRFTRSKWMETTRTATVVLRAHGAMCIVLGVVLTACSGKEEHTPASSDRPVVEGKFSTTPPPPAADTDKTVNGTGAPVGYSVQLDIPDPGSGHPSYVDDGHGRWEVRTGPAHILYAANDTAHKKYSLSTTFEQVEAPAHPEAYGIVFGGSSLDQPGKQQYTYFLVRGDGKYMVKVRKGNDTQTITDWTSHPAIPHQDASGKAVYGIRVDVDGKIAKVRVNGQPVTMISGPNTPVQGAAGLRINHNLHLMVTRLVVTRS